MTGNFRHGHNGRTLCHAPLHLARKVDPKNGDLLSAQLRLGNPAAINAASGNRTREWINSRVLYKPPCRWPKTSALYGLAPVQPVRTTISDLIRPIIFSYLSVEPGK
jgi:hypothetical protein